MNEGDLTVKEPPRCKFCRGPLREQPDKESRGFVFFKCDSCGMSNVANNPTHGNSKNE